MSKKINKTINYSLKTLTILAFIFIFLPLNIVSADYCGTAPGVGTGGTATSGYIYYNNPPVYQPPIYTPPPAPVPTVYSNANNNTVMTVTYTPAPVKHTGPKKAYKPYYVEVPVGTPGSVTHLPANATVKNNPDLNTTPNSPASLTANSLFGSNGFLPTGLVGWVILAIGILAIVILARTVFGAKQAYHDAPLKHE